MNLTRIKSLSPRLSALLFFIGSDPAVDLFRPRPQRCERRAGILRRGINSIPLSFYGFIRRFGRKPGSRQHTENTGTGGKAFFHLPACTACTVFMGFIGGYPVGAKMTASLLEQKRIDSKTAVRLLCFASMQVLLFNHCGGNRTFEKWKSWIAFAWLSVDFRYFNWPLAWISQSP